MIIFKQILRDIRNSEKVVLDRGNEAADVLRPEHVLMWDYKEIGGAGMNVSTKEVK